MTRRRHRLTRRAWLKEVGGALSRDVVFSGAAIEVRL
jgi:hypothetical protein